LPKKRETKTRKKTKQNTRTKQRGEQGQPKKKFLQRQGISKEPSLSDGNRFLFVRSHICFVHFFSCAQRENHTTQVFFYREQRREHFCCPLAEEKSSGKKKIRRRSRTASSSSSLELYVGVFFPFCVVVCARAEKRREVGSITKSCVCFLVLSCLIIIRSPPRARRPCASWAPSRRPFGSPRRASRKSSSSLAARSSP